MYDARMVSQTMLQLHEAPITLGNTERFLEILMVLLLVLIAFLIPFFCQVLFNTWKFMRDKSTADHPRVLHTFLFGNYIFWVGYLNSLVTIPLPVCLQFILSHGGTYGLSAAFVSLKAFSLPLLLVYIFGPSYIRSISYNTVCKIVFIVTPLCNVVLAVIAMYGPFPGSLWCLMLVRLIDGQATGWRAILNRTHGPAVIPSDQLVYYSFTGTSSGFLGLCLGPAMGSLCIPALKSIFRILGLGLQDLNPGAYVMLFLAVWSVVGSLILWACLPRELHVAGMQTVDQVRTRMWRVPDRIRLVIVPSLLVIGLFTQAVVLTVESFDVLLLETEYGWSVTQTGLFTTMATALACPCILGFSVLSKSLSRKTSEWIYYCAPIAAFVFSLAAFPYCPFHTTTGCVAFMIVFRSFMMVSVSLYSGWHGKQVVCWTMPNPEHWWSMRQCGLAISILTDGFMFAVAPFLMRSIYQHYGRMCTCIYMSGALVFLVCTVWIGVILPWRKYCC